MKCLIMSIDRKHNKNIESGLKRSELRTKAPNIKPPFRVYTYESGPDGRHKVVNSWICTSATTWLMYMGIPEHLSRYACISYGEIWRYCDKGNKNITELRISDLKIFDEPIDISEFFLACDKPEGTDCSKCIDANKNRCKSIKKAPQNWCYCEERMI